ncbi:hypothetical protein GCM10009678_01160 [Actinomadura kijaniata]
MAWPWEASDFIPGRDWPPWRTTVPPAGVAEGLGVAAAARSAGATAEAAPIPPVTSSAPAPRVATPRILIVLVFM